MIHKRSKLGHGMKVMASVPRTTLALVRGLADKKHGKRWLIPLVIFLCMTGALLILAGSVNAVAPFIYTIF
jgi:hypothetical protein